MAQLHRELRESLQQLQAIRTEMRSGISLSNPGCVLRMTAGCVAVPFSLGAVSGCHEAWQGRKLSV